MIEDRLTVYDEDGVEIGYLTDNGELVEVEYDEFAWLDDLDEEEE